MGAREEQRQERRWGRGGCTQRLQVGWAWERASGLGSSGRDLVTPNLSVTVERQSFEQPSPWAKN